MKYIISFLGLPASGKGTQSAYVSKHFNIPNYSVGQILRDAAENDTEMKKKIDEGFILPDSIVNSVVENLLKTIDSPCVLDGYPRSIAQAKFIEDQESIKILPIYFDIDEDVLLKRITSRIQCSKCNAVYNDEMLKDAFLCNYCGASEYYRRPDDAKNILLVRIDQFKKNTKPVLDFYKSLNMLQTLNAANSIGHIQQEVCMLIEQFIT